jgi:phosphatidylglycerophosphatase A
MSFPLKKHAPPPWRFLFAHPAHFIACGCGSGLSPVASGTVGTLFAWASYALLRAAYPSDWACGLFLLCMFLFGIWCCDVAGRHLGVADHGAIVWDEIVPFWMVLWLVPDTALWQLAAFLWFRFFDIVKPPPARFFDSRVKNGLGVMMDDLIAAAYTVFVLALFKALFAAAA